jgi:diguanylate cyclase (GGDEF)-like protein
MNVNRHRDQMLTEQRLFVRLIYTEAIILVLDSLMWLLDGKAGPVVGYTYIVATTLYYILNPMICMIWLLYVIFQIYKDIGRLRRMLIPVAIPVLFNMLLSVISVFTGSLFYFEGGNIYHRGPLFFIMALIAFFYLLCAWILTMLKRHLLPKHDLLPLAVFSLLPLLGGLFQSLFYGLNLIWPCATIAVLIIFVSFQNVQLYTDHLTGLNNRRQLDRFLQNRVQNDESGLLAGLMIDIDDFKKINDMHGHSSGDQALAETAEILRNTFRKNDFIARYGGDEFVVIVTVSEKADLQRAICRLEENVAAFNALRTAPYTISLSVGYDCFLDQKDKSAKEFIRHIDDLMYRSKQAGTGD